MALELLQLTEVRNYVQNSHWLKKKGYYFSIFLSGDTFSKSELNYFLSCVYDLRIGEKKDLSLFLIFYFSIHEITGISFLSLFYFIIFFHSDLHMNLLFHSVSHIILYFLPDKKGERKDLTCFH